MTRGRLSARDAARFVVGKLDTDAAAKLRVRLRDDDAPSLTPAERDAFVDVLTATGIENAMHDLGAAMQLGAPERSAGAGRTGRPPRAWLRRELGSLLDVLRRHVDPTEHRSVARLAAVLLLVHGYDAHATWWRAEGKGAPPAGDGSKGRVGWLAKRVAELAEPDAGQYARRTRTRKT